MILRSERAQDATAISRLTTTAFATAAHASGTEARIVEGLRSAGALTLSLVAEADGQVVGHAAFSPVTISDGTADWFGLGPVSVAPSRQGQGIGARLVRAGLAQLEAKGAAGVVVLGDPAYYGRFGFVADPQLVLPRIEPGYFQRLIIHGPAPRGEVTYHRAFDEG